VQFQLKVVEPWLAVKDGGGRWLRNGSTVSWRMRQGASSSVGSVGCEGGCRHTTCLLVNFTDQTSGQVAQPVCQKLSSPGRDFAIHQVEVASVCMIADDGDERAMVEGWSVCGIMRTPHDLIK
jgi:hypothetical protein